MSTAEGDLAVYMIEALRDGKPLAARALARILTDALEEEVQKGLVNRILYDRDDLFVASVGTPPRWSLTPQVIAELEPTIEEVPDYDLADDWDNADKPTTAPRAPPTQKTPTLPLREQPIPSRCAECGEITFEAQGAQGAQKVVLFEDNACTRLHQCGIERTLAPTPAQVSGPSKRRTELESLWRVRSEVNKTRLPRDNRVSPTASMLEESGPNICEQCGNLLIAGGRDRSCPHCAA